nr:putative Ig domain-containing protein [Spirosoma luteum]
MKKTFTALLFCLLVQAAFGQKEPAPTKGEPIPVGNTDVHVLTLPDGLRPGVGGPAKPVTTNALSTTGLMVFREENINSPNNTAATATPLGGTSVKMRGNLFPTGDVDFYSFNATAGDRVYAAVMTAFSAGSSTDSQLSLISSDGTTVIEFDDDNGSFAALSSSIAGAIIPTTGIYYLKVNDFTPGTTSERPYDLYLKVQSGIPTPEVEGNDTPATANDTPASGWISGSRNPAAATEQDWYAISLTAGETVFLSLDLDPERDGTTWNGRLGFALFGDASNQILVVDDAGTGDVSPNPTIPSEAFFFTVKETGTYYLFVDSATGATGGPTATYNLSVSKLAAIPGYTTYTSTDVPKTIGPGTGSVSSTLTIPDTKRIKDLAVRITLNHDLMADIDAILTTPEGNQIALFTDIGSGATGGQTQMDLRLSDFNAVPPAFTVLKGVALTPELGSKLDQLKGMKTNGTWTLTLYDDGANTSGGTLTSWALDVLEDTTPATLATATTIYSQDFESGDGGFTHSGTADSWARGTPNTPGTTTVNPVAPFTAANSGVNCWKTNLTGTYALGSDQTLESGDINLTGVTANVVTLSWAMKYQMESANFDQLAVYVEEVGGGGLTQVMFTWLGATQAAAVGSPVVNVPMSSGWGLYFADISAFKGKVIRFKVRLTADNTVSFAGVAIDDVKIYGDCTTPTATLSASSSTTLTCAQSSLTLTAGGGDTYVFSGPSVVSQSGNQAVVNASGIYSVTVTSVGGCSSTTSIAISQNNTAPTPTISASPSATLSCAQSSLTLTAGGGNTYVFSGPGVVNQSGNKAVVNAAGVYSVTVTNTSSGCFSTTAITISSNASAPSASLGSSGTLTCAVTSVTLTASPGGLSYVFSSGATQIGLSNQATVTTSGLYSVTVINAGNGCSGVASTSVSASTALPTATISGNTTVTSGGSTTLTVSGGNSQTWSTGETTPSISVTAGTYSVTVTNASGCSSSTSVTVSTVNSAPVATANANQTATVGVPFSYTVNAFSDADTPNSLTYTASISPANGFSFDPASRVISGTPSMSGVSSVTITATDPGSLSASTSFSITVNPVPPTPVFSITGVTTVSCQVLSAGQRRVSFNPRYAGLDGSPISFSVVNELLPTTAPGPYTLNLYTDNPVITLRALQSGASTSFAYNWLSACSSSTANTPPTVANPVPPQSATVGLAYTLSLANVFTDAETPNGLVLSVTGLPAGLNFVAPSTISGTPSMSGVSTVTVTATDPGSLSASTSFTLTVNPAAGTPPPPTGTFSITSVQTISCEVLSASQRRLTFTPQYAGLNGAPVSFSVVNELPTTTNPGPYTLNLYTDNPVITLRAVQSGVSSSFAYNWLAVCSSTTANTPPTVANAVPPQSATVGVAYTLSLANVFTDAETPNQLTLSVTGLPSGLSFNPPSTISGTPSMSGVSTVTVTATDPGGMMASTSFMLTVSPAGGTPPTGTFSITGVTTVSCQVLSAGQRRVSFTPRYAGLDGSPVSFSVVNEMLPTTAAGPYSLDLYTDNPVITLSAVQSGVSSSFSYGWLAACNPGARLGYGSDVSLKVIVLGNPVGGDQVWVEVQGEQGQSVTLRVMDEQGHAVSQQQGVLTKGRDRFGVRVGASGGVYLLDVSTAGQRQTVKLVRQ